MPLFSWMRLAHCDAERVRDQKLQADVPVAARAGFTPKLELRHIENNERLTSEVEGHHRGCVLGLSPLERCQLESAQAKINPNQNAAVLGRLREAMAHNSILPLELVSIYKHLLVDLDSTDEEDERIGATLPRCSPRRPPVDTRTSRYVTRRGFLLLTSSDRRPSLRTEIPTVSGSVEHGIAHRSVHKDCPNTSAPTSHCITQQQHTPGGTTTMEF